MSLCPKATSICPAKKLGLTPWELVQKFIHSLIEEFFHLTHLLRQPLPVVTLNRKLECRHVFEKERAGVAQVGLDAN